MAHSFTARYNGELSTLLQNVKTKITSEGGSFNGDSSNGSFSGKSALGEVSLKYQIQADNSIKFTIVDKPFLVPNSTVESTVRGYLA